VFPLGRGLPGEEAHIQQVTVAEVFDAILAGNPTWQVAPALQQLVSEDRQNLLCTVCAMHAEITRNCVAYGTEVNALLTAECPLYIHGIATCRF
jgi:hypothetical protein